MRHTIVKATRGILSLGVAISAAMAASTGDFVTRWKTDVANDSVEIGTNTTYATEYNYSIDCGDGGIITGTAVQTAAGVTGSTVCVYAASGTHDIRINGQFPSFQAIASVSPYENAPKLIGVEQWGTGEWKSFAYAFFFAKNLISFPTEAPTLTNVNNMQYAFAFAGQFNQPLNHWDVSNVTNMERVFYKATGFNQPLENWNVSNVTNTSNMFFRAETFNQPLDSWDVSSVTDMSRMFEYARSFDQSLASWNITRVTDMSRMLNDTKMSRDNYDATLIGWNEKSPLQSNVEVGAAGREFCSGKAARSNLSGANSWEFNGDTERCPGISFVGGTTTTIAVDEDQTAIGTVVASGGAAYTYVVMTGGADNEDRGAFAVTTGGVLSFVSAPDYESPTDANTDNVYNVRIAAMSGATIVYQDPFAVRVKDAAETASATSGKAFETGKTSPEKKPEKKPTEPTKEPTPTKKDEKKTPKTETKTPPSTAKTYGDTNCADTDLDENHKAYCFVRINDVVTVDGYSASNPESDLTRVDFAQMLVPFMQLLGKPLPAQIPAACATYNDIAGLTLDQQKAIVHACAYGVIGMKADGTTPLAWFMPQDKVIRAQFVTVISRILWGGKYNSTQPNDPKWAEGHLQAMFDHGYTKYITGGWPTRVEKRVYAWIMMMRIAADQK